MLSMKAEIISRSSITAALISNSIVVSSFSSILLGNPPPLRLYYICFETFCQRLIQKNLTFFAKLITFIRFNYISYAFVYVFVHLFVIIFCFGFLFSKPGFFNFFCFILRFCCIKPATKDFFPLICGRQTQKQKKRSDVY